MNQRIAIYLLKRLMAIVPTLFGITLVSFALVQIVPGGPVEKALQQMRFGGSLQHAQSSVEVTEELRTQLEKQFGFDKPVHERYLLWISSVIRADFGRSYYHERPVMEVIVERFPVSLTFGVFNFILVYLISIPLGIMKAVRKGSVFDGVTSGVLFTAYSIPPFALGILLIVFLCGGSYLSWFPLQGLVSENFEELSLGAKVIDYLHHAALPLLCYVIGSFALVTMIMRNALVEQLNQDYVRTARAKGNTERRVIWKHCFRNALIPIVTGLGSYIGLFLTGSLLIEQIFGLNGIGKLSYDSLLERDYPIVLAIVILGSVTTVLGHVLSDFLYTIVDPRIDFQ